MRDLPLAAMLALYAVASFSFSLLCSAVGRSATPLGAYQVYAVACTFWFIAGCCFTRPKRLWPPTKQEGLAALGAVLILTSETLALLSPASLVAVFVGKAGCLAIPDPSDNRPWSHKYRLAALTFMSVMLVSWGKPHTVVLSSVFLGMVYLIGNAVKLHAVRLAKGVPNLSSGFFGAGQVVVLGLNLGLSGIFAHAEPPASMLDWRLWLAGGASLSAGLLGLKILLRKEKQALMFPAYRATSLLCTVAATSVAGHTLGWTGLVGALLALSVVVWATAGKAIYRWSRLTYAASRLACADIGGQSWG